jgi:hypothetical protein
MRQMHIVSLLRATTWRELAGLAIGALLLASIAKKLAPETVEPLLHHAGLALPLLLLMAKDIAHAPQAWERLRSAHAARAPWYAHLTALLPPELPGLFKLDRLLWLGCLRRVQGQPLPVTLPEGVALTYLERGAYNTARAVVFVALLLELPTHALLLHLFIKDPDALMVIHVLGAIAVLYTLAWVLGDRWHIGPGRHVMTAEALHLRVGVRVEGTLPLAAIARVEPVDLLLPSWRHRHGVARRDTLVVTPFDKPNCVLVLHQEAQVDILLHQVTTRLPRYVFLYLDRPALLAAHVDRVRPTVSMPC